MRFSSPKGNGYVVTSNWGVGAGQAVRTDVRLCRGWAGIDGSVICHISQWDRCSSLLVKVFSHSLPSPMARR